MVCPKAKIFIDFHGSVIAKHVADRSWDINKFLMFLKQKSISWKDMYWKIWSRLLTYECSECEKMFVGAEIGHCSYHPQKAKFNFGSNMGL
jgi:hypothetical protein